MVMVIMHVVIVKILYYHIDSSMILNHVIDMLFLLLYIVLICIDL